MFVKFIASAGVCLSAAAVVKSDQPKEHSKQENSTAKYEYYKYRRSELPIYSPIHSKKKQNTLPPEESALRQSIQCGVRFLRVEVCKVGNIFAEKKRNVETFIENGTAKSKAVFDYLNQPGNTVPRIGAIAVGGLSGFILALRGGFFKRIVYTGIGSSVIASICYPKEAEVYAQHGLIESKKLTAIGYNFIFGVKPGDDINAPDWPKFPTNISEFTDSISDLTKSIKESHFWSKK